MPVTTDEILAKGKGPIPTTFVDEASTHTAADTYVSTGVENVAYDTKTAQGRPNNPKNAGETVTRGVVNVSKPQVRTDPREAQGNDRKLSYVEMFQEMSPYKPPTLEDLEKERKKQKREAIFAAIGDGISAMSNLYFTTQYAPDSYDASEGMAAKTKARFDQLKKEREQSQREYMNGYMRALQMDENAKYKETLAQMKEREQKRKENETNISIALKQADLDYKEAKKDGQEYINELYRLKGQALEAGMGAHVALIEEKIKTEQAKQQKYRQGGAGGGGVKAPEYPWYDRDGNLHYASSYEAMRQNALNHGTWSEATQQSTIEREQKDRRGNTKGTTSSTTTKPAKGHSTKPEGKSPNPMGAAGGGNQKKKNPMS